MAGYEWTGTQNVMTLFKSLNGGTTWEKYRPVSQNSYGYKVACVPGNSNIVYLGGRKGYDPVVYKTQDGGKNWKSVGANKFANDYDIRDIAIDPKSTNTVYVGTGRGLYRSKNSGDTWEKIFNSRVECLQFNKNNPKQIFIGGYWGVQTSKNRGDTWDDLSEGLTVDDINCLGINHKSKWVFAGSYGGGIFKKKY